jgi:D-glycero-alpha-D-manno-heptose-7-phosphate kinase
MIITRTPFRITLGGGGTDLPSFYREHGGFVFTMAINKYMHVIVHRLPVMERRFVIRYSKVESVPSVNDIEHPIVREALKLHEISDFLEITSIADIPAKTGLGSSGAYTVGLLKALRTLKDMASEPADVAHEACHLEMDILQDPVGKQDQYIAAYGGFRTLDIAKDGTVKVSSVPVDSYVVAELVQKACVYYTGIQRSAAVVLREQADGVGRSDSGASSQTKRSTQVEDSLLRIKDIGYQITQAFRDRDLDRFGVLMDEHWQSKRQLSGKVTLSAVEELYDLTKKEFGVLGGKIIGAGGGGFVMLYAPTRQRELDDFMASRGMPRVSFFPSMRGSTVVSDMQAADNFERVAAS